MTNLNQTWPVPTKGKPIVIVGTGGIVRDAHLPAYKKANFEVAGLTDLEPARANQLAIDFDVPTVFKSLEEAVDTLGTACVYDIAIPPNAITDILPDLPDGSAVLIQKPMGTDQNHAREIKEICRNKQLKAAINFQLRFSPMMLAVRDAMSKGMIGELLEVEVHLNVFTPWNLFPFLIPMKRVEIAVHSIHYLDMIRALAGNPIGVHARSIGDPRAKEFAQTRTSAIIDFGNQVRGIMSINHNHQCGRKFQSAWFRIEGTEGTLMVKLGVLYDYPNGEPDELWHCRNQGEWKQIELVGSWFIDAFMGTMANVQRYDAGEDRELYTSVNDAYQTMALVEACFKSMESQPTLVDLD